MVLGKLPEDPVVLLDPGEHPSRGKKIGKMTIQKAARTDILERRIMKEEVKRDDQEDCDVLLLDADELLMSE